MPTKEQFKRMSEETLKFVEQGIVSVGKETFNIKENIQVSLNNTKLYSPSEAHQLLEKEFNHSFQTRFEVTNETTLQACSRLVKNGEKVIALNFASAKNPGGGFLNGVNTQEESLARSSSLYSSLIQKKEMYEENKKKSNNGLYSDYMIYSPSISVFRTDTGNIVKPYPVSFITSPSVNAGIVPKHLESKVPETMQKRIEKILAVALENGYDTIVLGAFGCGVFKNPPKQVAKYFKDALNSPKFKGQFKKVTFAIYDTTPAKVSFYAFRNTFGVR